MQINRKYIINISDVELVDLSNKFMLSNDKFLAKVIITTTTGDISIERDYFVNKDLLGNESNKQQHIIDEHKAYVESLLVGEY